MNIQDELQEHKCPICNRMFVVLSTKNYGWKFNNRCYCSYSCMRVHEKKYLEKVNANLRGFNDGKRKNLYKRKK